MSEGNGLSHEELVEILLERRKADQLLIDEFGNWVPDWIVGSFRFDRQQSYLFLRNRYSHESVLNFIDLEFKDELYVPGLEEDSVAFLHAIHQLTNLAYIISLGSEKGTAEIAGASAGAGVKTALARRQGHKKHFDQLYGSESDKKKKYQNFIDKLSTERISLSYEDLKSRAACHFEVSPSTIKRYTTNPKRSK
jgi:hypothetical protein